MERRLIDHFAAHDKTTTYFRHSFDAILIPSMELAG